MSGPARIMMAMSSPIRWRRAFGSLGLMTSVLDDAGRQKRSRPRQPTGTVTRHYPPCIQEGKADIDQFDGLDLCLEPRSLGPSRQASTRTRSSRPFRRHGSRRVPVADDRKTGKMTKDLAVAGWSRIRPGCRPKASSTLSIRGCRKLWPSAYPRKSLQDFFG